MPWYRMEVSHGPGHMSTEMFYRYSGTKIVEQYGCTVDELLKDFFGSDADQDWDYPIYRFSEVDELPQEVRDDMIKGYKKTITNAEYMLVILGARKRRKGKK